MNISKIRTVMTEEGVIFSFSGLISQSLTSFMIKTAQAQLEDMKEDGKVIKTLFLIAIEQLQNVMSYSKNKHIENGNKFTSPGVLVIGINKEKRKILCYKFK